MQTAVIFIPSCTNELCFRTKWGQRKKIGTRQREKFMMTFLELHLIKISLMGRGEKGLANKQLVSVHIQPSGLGKFPNHSSLSLIHCGPDLFTRFIFKNIAHLITPAKRCTVFY